jgi:hypothetical protein
LLRLRALRVSVWRARFSAEKWFAMFGPLPSFPLISLERDLQVSVN